MFVTTQTTYRYKDQPAMDRTVRRKAQQRCKQISRHAVEHAGVDFFNVLSGPELLAKTEEHLTEYRERLYPPTVALAMFIKQALSEDRSCQNAVNGWAAQRAAEGLEVRWVGTSGYCQARQRLSLEMVKGVAHEVGRLLSETAPLGWRWRGRRVKLVDGTGISMPDTPANRSAYPQLSSQAAGVGFPIARLVTVICLSTGAVLEGQMGRFEGCGHSELDLLRSLLEAFVAGDVMLADALYCNYFLIAALQQAGVEVLFEQHGSRNTDFRLGEKLGKRDHRVYWQRPKRPQWMSEEQYATVPEELCVRELQAGGRVLVTTFVNSRAVCKRALSRLYEQRWHVELDLRNIKTTLGMEILSCRSPDMVEKELWVYLLAYNIVRLLMAQGAVQHGVSPRQISFKHTAQLWVQWQVSACEDTPILLPSLIGQVRVGKRPGRLEPRARKRRPKSYQWLKVRRGKAKQQIRKYGYLPNP
jgi:hypothetical protein